MTKIPQLEGHDFWLRSVNKEAKNITLASLPIHIFEQVSYQTLATQVDGTGVF